MAVSAPEAAVGHCRPIKISSLDAAVIISFIIVAALKEIVPKQQEIFSTSDELSPMPRAEAEAEDTALAWPEKTSIAGS